MKICKTINDTVFANVYSDKVRIFLLSYFGKIVHFLNSFFERSGKAFVI